MNRKPQRYFKDDSYLLNNSDQSGVYRAAMSNKEPTEEERKALIKRRKKSPSKAIYV